MHSKRVLSGVNNINRFSQMNSFGRHDAIMGMQN